MIVGIGTDLVEIERIKKACEKEAFLSRVYTEREQKNKGESWHKRRVKKEKRRNRKK